MHPPRLIPLLLCGTFLLAHPSPAAAHEKGSGNPTPGPTTPIMDVACSGGQADVFPCNNVDLLAFLPLNSIGGGAVNDVWGWTDPTNGREYAVVGRSPGTAFVDVTDPVNPLYLGELRTRTTASAWRDVKVYQNHAFVVSEAPGHGMQVFDLTRLRSPASTPQTFASDAVYDGFSSAHNLAINEDSGFAYAVGTNTCGSGLHIIDIRTPRTPTLAGCFSSDGYTHDAHCITYGGPDAEHAGREVCFNANEDTLTIVDVTDKTAPVQLSRTGYEGFGYTHQGWVTADQRYYLADDELDEINGGHNTRTYVWDVSDLDAPFVVGAHDGDSRSIDHNQYVRDGHVYQANYRSGLHVLRLDDLSAAQLTEVASFDLYPPDDAPSFNGAWSVYPFFPSGNVLLSGIEQGLFVLRPHLGGTPVATPTPTPTALPALHISGRVVHYASGLPVDAVEVTLQGDSAASGTTDPSGSYRFEGLSSAPSTVEPRKAETTSHPQVGALDAVFVLQAAIGERQFDRWQELACDVTGNGTVSSLDAVQILRYGVALIERFPVAQLCDSDWIFAPQAAAAPNQELTHPQIMPGTCRRGAIGFSPLSTNADAQSFDAALFGDCTASWQPAGAGAAALVGRGATTSAVRLGRPQRSRSRDPRRGRIRVPLYVTQTESFHALDVLVRYNRALLRPVRVQGTSAVRSATVVENLGIPGQVRFALASAAPVQTSEKPVLYLVFEQRGRRSLRSLRRSVYLLDAKMDGGPS